MNTENPDNIQEDEFMFNENFSDPELEAYLNSHLLRDNSNSSNLLEISKRRFRNKNHFTNQFGSITCTSNINSQEGISQILNQYSQNMNYGGFYMYRESIQNSKKQQHAKRRYNISENFKKSTRPIIRKKVQLTKKAIEFKEKYYLVFTNLKKFPEKFIIGIHNCFFIRDLGLKKIERYQYRSINNYFQCFSDDSDMILSYLMTHKNVIQSVFPDLINNGWKKNNCKL